MFGPGSPTLTVDHNVSSLAAGVGPAYLLCFVQPFYQHDLHHLCPNLKTFGVYVVFITEGLWNCSSEPLSTFLHFHT